MQIHIQPFTVHKRFALTISRGTTASTTNLWVKVMHDGIEGWGEASPFAADSTPQTTEAIAAALEQIIPALVEFTPWQRQSIEQLLLDAQIPSAARAGLDMALHDWMGKRLGIPLWQLWGLDRSRIVPTSVTIGISSPDAAHQRLQAWMELTKIQAVKVKLGNPEGLEADQMMLMAVLEELPLGVQVSVNANGGWNLNQAVQMSYWLAGHGIVYVEQPLAKGREAELPELFQRSPLPIFVDESCFQSSDIPLLADRVHGINIKLMKCGGLTEAWRMVQTAKACKLQIMFGCYSDSSLANTATVQLGAWANYLDLDSHLNLVDDPFIGATMQNGQLLPNDAAGLGVRYGATDR